MTQIAIIVLAVVVIVKVGVVASIIYKNRGSR